jgi:protein-S-isoprenylcysteine O-methyltransferase Ste14
MQRIDTLLDIALIVAGGSTLIVFAVALQNFFVQPPVLTRGQRLFQDWSVLLGVTHGFSLVALTPAGEGWIWAGLVMYGLSLSVFLSAIEAARQVPMTRTFVYEPRCTNFINRGPYRYIRHPIYLSYTLAWWAAPAAMNSGWLGLTAAFMTGSYIVSALEEERLMATSVVAEEYAKYRTTTTRFIPFLF